MITLKDMFCGCGGSSTGAVNVPGVEVKYAMNHWKLAIESHNTNHPNTHHDCADISETHPARYDRTTGLIASPECTNHSLAKGARRKNLAQGDFFQQTAIDPGAVRSRATMWDVVRFTEQHRYEFVVVENVVDVRYWVLYDAWLKSMHALGYRHQCVYLNAMFAHGDGITGFAPQSRDRIYIVFTKKGNPVPNLDIRPPAPCPRCGVMEAVQSWKNGRTAGKYKQQYVYRCSGCHQEVKPFYYAALNALDLSLPMERIGDRKKPLSEKTVARIEYGLKKYGLRPTVLDQRNQHGHEGSRIRSAEMDALNAQSTHFSSYMFSPFLFNMAFSHAQGDRSVGLHETVPTQTTQQSMGFVSPFLLANREGSPPRALDDAMHTVVTSQQEMMIAPAFMPIFRNHGTAHALTDELPTVTTSRNHNGLVLAPSALLTMRGPRSLDGVTDPLATQTCAIQNWLFSNARFLTPYHGGSNQASDVLDPSPTIPTRDSLSLVESRVQPAVEDCYFRMLQPHETARAQGFPGDYVILGTKDQKQKQIGNANPPPTMELLVRRCVDSLQ